MELGVDLLRILKYGMKADVSVMDKQNNFLFKHGIQFTCDIGHNDVAPGDLIVVEVKPEGKRNSNKHHNLQTQRSLWLDEECGDVEDDGGFIKNSNPDNLTTFQVRNQSGRLKLYNNIYHVINSISKHSAIKCMPTTKAQLRNQYKILEVICERLLYFYNDFEAVLGLRVETTVKRVRTIVSFYI